MGALDSDQCARHLQILTSLCAALGVPLAEDKKEGPITCLEYLGILSVSAALEARLPLDKLQDIHDAIRAWTSRTSCSKWELHTFPHRHPQLCCQGGPSRQDLPQEDD